ncbi:ketoacyl-synt-domain-containing protein [Aspergillus heteromorphus CBS 117.55]|uniref:Ketoacyl-synt-domain-containing protein n=1 Tax=Aspergillus heteromorphus CBS 117.55 TaxID=1448321 RepID=A0A317UX20_9EURO|nr:ketoacyl-synt-domain-containing protein [Aspergillus heteromorphus CBS 117.55]PWY66076.1 ketoacyl-synt-domain-containing protein [Aspergillus heteromorphus CBS 117.55]
MAGYEISSGYGYSMIYLGIQDSTLQAILVDQSHWYRTFSDAQSDRLQGKESQIARFGPERCVPPSLLPKLGSRIVHVADLDLHHLRPAHELATPLSSTAEDDDPTDCRIAVVGMSCQVPGARDLEQFSALLREGKSQHIEVASSRFEMDTVWRTLDKKRKWYGNFIDDHDSFGYRFFKKSPRERNGLEHRLILQAAYQALEQSGYFHDQRFPDKHIGCFLGVGLVDYESNIACHPASAYAATENLKSFAAGRVSHYFGWTGPSLMLDTACSSSAVAVHQACRASLHNECSAALAGAANVMTSPDWFHNLAGVSELGNLTDFASLLRCIEAVLGYSAGGEQESAGEVGPVQVNGTRVNGTQINKVNGTSHTKCHSNGVLAGMATAVREAFAITKQSTDTFIEQYGLADYNRKILPTSTELVIVHILDATVSRISYLPRHERFVDFIYEMLEKTAGLVVVEGARITRTSTPCPEKSATVLLEQLLADGSNHSFDHRLTYMTGSRLADCLSGAVDGVQLLFGSAEGREQATGMYSQSPINLPWIRQMEFLLQEFFAHLPAGSGTINILEMGAGTGGTTSIMAPLLARMGVDVIYTVTDISSSFVAGLRKRFKQYPFMRFKMINIEEQPAADLLQSQHIVIATNCIHATQDLVRSSTVNPGTTSYTSYLISSTRPPSSPSRSGPGACENPAARLVDFLDEHFVAMSCDTNMVLDTANSREHSVTLASAEAVGVELVGMYVRRWKEMEFGWGCVELLKLARKSKTDRRGRSRGENRR